MCWIGCFLLSCLYTYSNSGIYHHANSVRDDFANVKAFLNAFKFFFCDLLPILCRLWRTRIAPHLCRFCAVSLLARPCLDTGGGDYAGLRGGGATQTQKRVKLGHSSCYCLCLYIKKLYRISLFCKYTGNLHCKSGIYPAQTVNISSLYRFILTFIEKYVIILTIINNKYKKQTKEARLATLSHN